METLDRILAYSIASVFMVFAVAFVTWDVIRKVGLRSLLKAIGTWVCLALFFLLFLYLEMKIMTILFFILIVMFPIFFLIYVAMY